MLGKQQPGRITLKRLFAFFLPAALVLAACEPAPPRLGPDGRPLPQVYQLSATDSRVQYRLLDAVNALRQSAAVPPLELDSRLTAAAATHSRDMAVQNRPWHFGSDGSSPIDRVQRAGYDGRMLGETISESYETEIETLAAWMEQPDTRRVILDRAATDLGFAWYQESNGKIWWTLVTGARSFGAGPGV